MEIDPVAGTFVRVEYYAQKTATSTRYGVRWLEFGAGTQVVHEITPVNGAVTADGLNHSFFLSRHGNGPQWDVFYDFHPVGTTARQTAGTTSSVDVGIETSVAAAVFPTFENRIQYMTGTSVLQRVPVANTTVVNLLGECGATFRPPACFTTARSGSPNLVSFSVTKPATLTAAVPQTAVTVAADTTRAWTPARPAAPSNSTAARRPTATAPRVAVAAPAGPLEFVDAASVPAAQRATLPAAVPIGQYRRAQIGARSLPTAPRPTVAPDPDPDLRTQCAAQASADAPKGWLRSRFEVCIKDPAI